MVVKLPPVTLARFTVEEYQHKIETGGFTEDDNLELIEGWLVRKMSHGVNHDNAIELIDEALAPLLPADVRRRIQSTITTADSQPEPDFVLVRGTVRSRDGRHPGPADLELVVEVSDSSLDYDRTFKQRIYARAGIAVYWIVNLIDRQVEVYTLPQPTLDEPRFANRTDYREGESVPVVIQAQEIGRVAVADLLPSGS
jgi:Uma2 family endonuclease